MTKFANEHKAMCRWRKLSEKAIPCAVFPTAMRLLSYELSCGIERDVCTLSNVMWKGGVSGANKVGLWSVCLNG